MTAIQRFNSLSKAQRVLTTVAGVLVSLGIIGSAVAYSVSKANEIHFDYEAEIMRLDNEAARLVIVAQHQTDKVNSMQARKNDRLDRLDRDITKIDEAILFDKSLTPDQKQYKRDLRADLVRKKECVIKGEC